MRPQDGYFAPTHVMSDDGVWTYKPRWELASMTGGKIEELDVETRRLMADLADEADAIMEMLAQ